MKGEKNPDKPGSVEERLVRLETIVEGHEDRLKRIENHLSEIQRELSRHSAYFKILGAIGTASLGGILTVILMLLLGAP